MDAVVNAREPKDEYLHTTAPTLLHAFDLFASAPGAAGTLRGLILLLAVQGKLSQRDASDVPASELLAQIRAERGRREASTEHALAVIARPFDIPSSWEWSSLGEVVELIRGITFPASEKTKEPAPNRIACLRTTNVQHSIEWRDLLFVDRSYMGREAQLIRHHDIVMSMANSRELVGKVALIESVPHAEATFGGFLGVLRPRFIDPRYVMAVLRTGYARQALIGSASQTTNIANISLSKLRPLPFPLPPLAEQHRIVVRVEELMKLCDSLERSGRLADEQHARLTSTLFAALAVSESAHALAENWQRVADHFDLLLDRSEAIDIFEQTVLRLAVRGALVPQDPRELHSEVLLASQHLAESTVRDEDDADSGLPESWRWGSLGELMRDLRYGTSAKCSYNVTGVPVLRIPNLNKGRVLISDLKFGPLTPDEAERLRLEVGDLLIVRSNGSASLVGSAAIVGQEAQGFAFAGYLMRLRVRNDAVLPPYVLLVLETPNVRNQIEGPLRTTSGVKNINSTEVARIRIPLPPLGEQRRIVARVEELRSLCASLRRCFVLAQDTQTRLADTLVTEVA